MIKKFFSALFGSLPKVQRSVEAQAKVDLETKSLALYQFASCPYCAKVRLTMRRLNLDIQLRDAKNDPEHKLNLIQQGGKYQVPCLLLTSSDGVKKWLYESSDINRYLEERFAQSSL